MSEENKNLEKPYSKKRTILKWIFIGLGIFFIAIGVLAPVILFIMAGGMGWWLPVIYSVAFDYSPVFIFLGIISILIGSIFQKASLIKEILLILLIILSIPNIFKTTIGTFVGYRWEKNTLVSTSEGTEVSKEKLTEITNKAVLTENPAECKKLFPFSSLPPYIASRLLPESFNPYTHPFDGALTAIFPFIPSKGYARGPLWYILRDPFTECVAEVAKKKKDTKICELPDSSYPFDKKECEYKIYYDIKVPLYISILARAIEADESKICDGIDNLCWFNECIYKVAAKIKDINLCERIKKEEKCYIDHYEICYYTISPELPPEHMWKTYSVYGYEIKYPAIWVVSQNSGSYCPGVFKSCITTSFASLGGEKVKIYFYNPSLDAITIKKYNPFSSNAPNIFEIEKDMNLIKTEKEKMRDSEYYFEKFFYAPKERVEKENMILVKWIAGSLENSGAMVIYYKDEMDKNLRIFNQMLSTFSFSE